MLSIRSIERPSFTEWYITGTVEPSDDEEQGLALLDHAAAVLAERDAWPIQEKLYGSPDAREAVEARRSAAWTARGLDLSVPFTWLTGAPPWGPGFAGFQVWGVSRGGPVRTDRGARRWDAPGFRLVYLPRVRGARPDGALPPTVTEQAERMFDNARGSLAGHGFAYRQVARTWIYFARLLDWYGEFNRVRTAHHARITGADALDDVVFPASTGIQGRHDDEECFMDVLALDVTDPAAVQVEPVRTSDRQTPAFRYGSAFSRGMALVTGGRRTLWVSGTASIGPGGESVHVDHAEAQILEMLLSVAALLEGQGAELRDIVTATLFCKTPAVYAAARRVTRLLDLPHLPAVSVRADVCRPDLLVELEAVAADTGEGAREGA